MHDLRRQALESGKTVSRKAQSRQTSRPTSPTTSQQNSRPSSRNASRNPSDEEEGGELSDGTAWSVNSVDDIPTSDEIDQALEVWTGDLNERIEELIDRKRSSIQGRETCLQAYIRTLTAHYAADEIEGKTSELLTAFGKSIKSESSEKETILALKALALSVITNPDDTIYEVVAPLLKRTISDSTSLPTKAAAIHCLGTCAFFGGAGDEEILDQMTFLLEIVSSDGHFIDAPDDAVAVTAALEEWGFLATEIADLEAESEDAVEAFADQLESSSPEVQIAAGENIALLYEKSYTPRDDDDDDEGEEEEEDADAASDSDDGIATHNDLSSSSDDDNPTPGPKSTKRYAAYHNTPQLITQLTALANLSTHHLSRKAKRILHQSFSSILTTVQNPRLGPHHSNAIDNNSDRHYGSRMTVKIHREGEMKVDKWWKWMRLGALRRVLQGGFVGHYYQGNRAVVGCLPVIIRERRKKGRGDDEFGAGFLQVPGSKKEKNKGKAGVKGGKSKGSFNGVL